MEKYYTSIPSLDFLYGRVSVTASVFGGQESGSVKVKLGRVYGCLLLTYSKAGVQLFDINKFQTQLLLCLLLESSLAWQPACESLKPRWKNEFKAVRGKQSTHPLNSHFAACPCQREPAFFASLSSNPKESHNHALSSSSCWSSIFLSRPHAETVCVLPVIKQTRYYVSSVCPPK